MKRSATALALCSSSLAAFQVVLMQLLSLTQWHHFAALVVAVALLGFGVSGTVLSLFRAAVLRSARVVVPAAMLAGGILMAAVVPLSGRAPFRFDSLLVFVDPLHILGVVLSCVLFSLPVFAGALAIGTVLVDRADRAGLLYAATLLGSGAGAGAAIALAAVFAPWQTAPLLAIPAIVSGAVTGGRAGVIRFALATGGVTAALTLTLTADPAILSQYKPLARAQLLPGLEQIAEFPSRSGVTTVVSSPSLRYAPGVSLTDPVDAPALPVLFVNGEWAGPLYGRDTALVRRVMDRTTLALPFVIAKPLRVFVPDAGTASLALYASASGAVEVAAVDPRDAVVDFVRRWTGRWVETAGMHIAAVPARGFLRETRQRFDLMMLPLFGGFGGVSGLDAMREEYMMTREAFDEMWGKLGPGGAISVSAWMDYPPRASVRIFTWAVDGLAKAGIVDARSHLVAVRSWGTVTLVVMREPLTDAQGEAARFFCERMGFDPVLLPDLPADERNVNNVLSDDSFLAAVDGVVSGRMAETLDRYPFDLRPPSDNRPFFHQFLRLSGLDETADLLGAGTLPFLEAGYFIVLVTFAVVAVLAFFLILVPLRAMARSGRGLRVHAYFGCLGLAYMLVEILLMQRCVLPLGEPVTAAAAVLGSMLVSSGLGSLWSARYRPDPASVRWATGAAALLLLLLLFSDVPSRLLSVPYPLRLAALCLAITPAGFVLGMPFPLGLRVLAAGAPESLPWAWGMNGYASVVGSALAPVLAAEAGFSVVLGGAAALYLIAAAGGLPRSVRVSGDGAT